MKRILSVRTGIVFWSLAACLPLAAAEARTYAKPEHDPATWTWSVPDPVAGVTHGELFSEAMQRSVGFNVYLPPDYPADETRRYPVVYFLHGAGGNEKSDSGFSGIVDADIRAGKLAGVIYVFPNGGRFGSYSDWPDENVKVETFLVRELIPHIDAAYRTLGTREGRAICGYSMGGDGSVRLAMKHPELFCAAAPMAGAFGWGHGAQPGDSAFDWARRNADRIRGRLGLKFVVGGQDRFLNHHHRLLAHLDELKIGYDYTVHPEVGHNLGKLTHLSGREIIHWLARHYALARVEDGASPPSP